MRELRILKWCDTCHAEGTTVEATQQFIINIDPPHLTRPARPRSLDLCERHAEPIESLRDFVLKVGVLADSSAPAEEEPPAADERRRPCPVCDKVMDRASVVAHLITMHGASRIKQPKRCPDCGKSMAILVQMVKHRVLAHHYDYLAEVVATVPASRGRKGGGP